jgi:NO-binding membrane sensor protein with MHYT domain
MSFLLLAKYTHMLENFFVNGPVPLNAEMGTYDPLLVLASYVVASLASFAALTLATQLFNAKTTREKTVLHLTGAMALGAGIWSMHFIGMLAYKIRMTVSYDPWLTALSMAIAVAVAFLVFQILQ